MNLSRSEAEWLVAHALFVSGLITKKELRFETLLALPNVMGKCRGCGRTIYLNCMYCLYRTGDGEIMDAQDEFAYEPDLIDQMRAVRLDAGYRLELAWNSMRRQRVGLCDENE